MTQERMTPLEGAVRPHAGWWQCTLSRHASATDQLAICEASRVHMLEGGSDVDDNDAGHQPDWTGRASCLAKEGKVGHGS